MPPEFRKFVTSKNPIAMLRVNKIPYESPAAEVVHVKLEGIVCVSKLRYNRTPGKVADDIFEDEIIDGGSF